MNNDYKSYAVRAAAILTGSYVAGTVISNTEGSSQLGILVNFTIGSLTDASIKVEFSADGTNYYQETSSAVSAGVSTESLKSHKFAATGAYRLELINIKDRYIKISAIGNGTATSSSMTVDAIIGSSNR